MPVDDALGQALDDGGLAHARLADQHRVVLLAARQDLDDALDLLLAPDDRVELALARQLREVAAELVQGRRLGPLLALLRPGARGRAAQQLQRLLAHPLAVHAQLEQHLRRHPLALADQPEQQVLGADVVVARVRAPPRPPAPAPAWRAA